MGSLPAVFLRFSIKLKIELKDADEQSPSFSQFLSLSLQRWIKWKLTICQYFSVECSFLSTCLLIGHRPLRYFQWKGFSLMLSVFPQTHHSVWDMINILYTVIHCDSLLCVVLSYRQMVPRQPVQQATPQCPLNSTETRGNTFSLWPPLFYLIIQNSVNLNLIAVCHGEAHWASVWEQLFTKHTAAGPLLFEVGDEAVAGDRLTCSLAPVCFLFVTAKNLDVTLVAEHGVESRNSLLYFILGESF